MRPIADVRLESLQVKSDRTQLEKKRDRTTSQRLRHTGSVPGCHPIC
ncbi:hypothetical protein [Coleofasciculus chthonoplastes]